MNFHTQFLTRNACFIAYKKITPTGIMVHSTGADNANLCRYVGPDDGLIGHNTYGNHWNAFHAGGKNIGTHEFVNNGKGVCVTCGGRQVAVHAFIGRLANGSVATYQTLPWDCRAWHCGGDANSSHIGFEICEDGLSDRQYFDDVYREAVELCAMLCGMFGIDPRYMSATQGIIDHSWGHKLGVASGHSDVMHWFPRHGADMGLFRADVFKLMSGGLTVDQYNELKALVDKVIKAQVNDVANLQKRIAELASAAGASVAGTGDAPSKWAAEATAYCKRKGIFRGDGAGNYGWQRPLSVERAAQIIYNTLRAAGTLEMLPDVPYPQ